MLINDLTLLILPKYLKIFLTFFISIILLLGFTEQANLLVGNWYQQFLPNIGNRQIQDITFIDSLTGYMAARQTSDTSYILKTTDGGNIWQIIFRNFFAMTQVQFLNVNTGYCVGAYLYKTTDGGFNWNQVTAPAISPEELFVLNVDTIWIVSSNSAAGGVYRTTNAGVNWTQQFSGGNQNPNKIYMYNARIGFMSNSSALPNIYKTTNSGINWSIIVSGERFTDISFVDSLTGWRTKGDTMKYTSNGGINWSIQLMPFGGIIESNVMTKFTALNKDTIWGCGGYVHFPNNQYRGILYRTTNSGVNWFFQIPDTSLSIVAQYGFINFTGKKYGWCYANFPTYISGIHTTNGGYTTFLTGVQQISTKIPNEFTLYQNFPNPFNPVTNIRYGLRIKKFVTLKIFDIMGKDISTLVNQTQNAGTYQTDFSGVNLSSGVYFYRLLIDGVLIDTKKMLLIK